MKGQVDIKKNLVRVQSSALLPTHQWKQPVPSKFIWKSFHGNGSCCKRGSRFPKMILWQHKLLHGSRFQPLQSQVSPRDLLPPPLPCCHFVSFEVTRHCLPGPQYAAHWREEIFEFGDIWEIGVWKHLLCHPFPTAPWPWCPCRPPSFVCQNYIFR